MPNKTKWCVNTFGIYVEVYCVCGIFSVNNNLFLHCNIESNINNVLFAWVFIYSNYDFSHIYKFSK